MIFATTINPRRSVKSFLGISTSTISGETIAGEMNLKRDDKNPNIVYYARMTDLRKMKAPIAENLESGQTCELYECSVPKLRGLERV